MLLDNVYIAGQSFPSRICIDGSIINSVEPATGQLQLATDRTSISFNSPVIAFPGLINSHDHLDFNLFPSLGDRTYSNYTEWGRYIHSHYQDKIERVLKIPVHLREQWGIYKNLINGITTVINHGKKIKKHTDPITVYEHCQCIHSVGFEKKW